MKLELIEKRDCGPGHLPGGRALITNIAAQFRRTFTFPEFAYFSI
jgi:hypothetical protein